MAVVPNILLGPPHTRLAVRRDGILIREGEIYPRPDTTRTAPCFVVQPGRLVQLP